MTTDNRKLVYFLYSLMRDHVPCGVVEKILKESSSGTTTYSNEFLAQYAQLISDILVEED